jgi:penicillin amidase
LAVVNVSPRSSHCDSFIEAQSDNCQLHCAPILPLIGDLWFTGEAAPAGTPQWRQDALALLAEWNA